MLVKERIDVPSRLREEAVVIREVPVATGALEIIRSVRS